MLYGGGGGDGNGNGDDDDVDSSDEKWASLSELIFTDYVQG